MWEARRQWNLADVSPNLHAANQVIVVTHLPQVASWAERQYVVSKETGKEGTHTTVREVSGGERVREIARMLAGSESKTSLEHARELLHESEIE